MSLEFNEALENIQLCDDDSLDALTRAISENPSILKEVSDHGQSLLHAAVALTVDPSKIERRNQIIAALIKAIQDNGQAYLYGYGYRSLFNLQDSEGNTPLHLAMAAADYHTANKLVDTGWLNLSLVRQQDNQPAYGVRVLYAAPPSEELLGKLLPLDITFAALHILILQFDESLIAALPRILNYNPQLLNQQDPKTKQTLLHAMIASTAENDNKKQLQTALIACILTAILQHKTWIYHPLTLSDAQGNTPLHIAMSMGNVELADALIKTGKIDKESANTEGKTIYAMAIEKGICTEHLATLKPTAVKTEEISLTTVMQKMQDCDDAALDLLVRAIKENPAIINQQDETTKETLLSCAIKLAVNEDKKNSLRSFLISTIITAIEVTTYTPYFSSHPFTLKDNDGNTPLHLTIIHRDSVTRERLRGLDHVDLAAVNNVGETAYALACKPDAFIDQIGRASLNPEQAAKTTEEPSVSWYTSFDLSAFRAAIPVLQSTIQDASAVGLEQTQPQVDQTVQVVEKERMMESLSDGDEQQHSSLPQLQEPQPKKLTPPRELSPELRAAFNYIKGLPIQVGLTPLILVKFKREILALEQYALQLQETVKSFEVARYTEAAEAAYNLLDPSLKSVTLIDHLRVLAAEFLWNIELPQKPLEKLDSDYLPPLFTYKQKSEMLRKKFSQQSFIDQALILKLQELQDTLDIINNENPNNPALMTIIDAISNLIRTLEGTDPQAKKIAAGTFSNTVIPAILALEKQDNSWSLREIFMRILNYFFENKPSNAVDAPQVATLSVANPINCWQAYLLSTCRKEIAVYTTELTLKSPSISG